MTHLWLSLVQSQTTFHNKHQCDVQIYQGLGLNPSFIRIPMNHNVRKAWLCYMVKSSGPLVGYTTGADPCFNDLKRLCYKQFIILTGLDEPSMIRPIRVPWRVTYVSHEAAVMARWMNLPHVISRHYRWKNTYTIERAYSLLGLERIRKVPSGLPARSRSAACRGKFSLYHVFSSLWAIAGLGSTWSLVSDDTGPL